MAGALLNLGTLTVAGALAGALAITASASVTAQRAAGAADNAALAAADAASGYAVGEPCARAQEVAEAVGARLDECRVDGFIARVRVSVPVAVWRAEAVARAGPP